MFIAWSACTYVFHATVSSTSTISVVIIETKFIRPKLRDLTVFFIRAH